MKKVFITGGAGFIGSRIVHKFVREGYQVYVYDNFQQYLLPESLGRQPNLLVRLAEIYDQIKILRGDTLRKDFLRRSLNAVKPDIIVHMAALPLATLAIEQAEEAFESILDGTINIMEVMRDFNHQCRMVYASSSTVYGDFIVDPVSEEAPTKPKDIYGSFKLCGEIMTNGYSQRYGLDTAIVRPSAVYGPYDGNRRVLYKFIKAALERKTLMVEGDGSSKLDFSYVDDVANGFFLVATHPAATGQTFNITRGKSEKLSTAIEIISEYIDGVNVEYGPVQSHTARRGTLDITKAKEVLGYEPEYDLANGLKRYIEHLRICDI